MSRIHLIVQSLSQRLLNSPVDHAPVPLLRARIEARNFSFNSLREMIRKLVRNFIQREEFRTFINLGCACEQDE